MASLRSSVVQNHLQTLFNEGAVGALTDGELLERFITRREEAAEAAIDNPAASSTFVITPPNRVCALLRPAGHLHL